MLRTRLIQAGLGLLVVAIVGGTLHALNTHPKPPPPATVPVTRGVVLATVSATGNVNAVQFTSRAFSGRHPARRAPRRWRVRG